MSFWLMCVVIRVKKTADREEKHRLDKLLEKKAKQGVKMYVFCVFQFPLLVNNFSKFNKEFLEGLHENIKVVRHPNNILPVIYSHHQKFVVVDQIIAFVGGIDLAWGRYSPFQRFLVSFSLFSLLSLDKGGTGTSTN